MDGKFERGATFYFNVERFEKNDQYIAKNSGKRVHPQFIEVLEKPQGCFKWPIKNCKHHT